MTTRPASLTPEFLDGLVKRVPGSTGNTWKLTEVYTGDLLVELPQSSEEDVVQAVADARAAQAIWGSWSIKKRLKVMKKFHSLVIDNQMLITDLIQAESGKNRRMAFEETCDVPMGTSHYIKRAPKLLKDRKITLDLTEAAERWLGRVGYDPVYGARPLKRAVQRYLQDPLAEKLLGGEIPDGSTVKIDEGEGALAISVG